MHKNPIIQLFIVKKSHIWLKKNKTFELGNLIMKKVIITELKIIISGTCET